MLSTSKSLAGKPKVSDGESSLLTSHYLRVRALSIHAFPSCARVDFLLGNVTMLGLTRNDEFARRRFPTERASQAKTWILVTNLECVPLSPLPHDPLRN